MSENILNGLSEIIKKGMETMNVPGLSIAIVKDGNVIYSEGFGYSDLENKINMKADTILPIGSATKSFTATAALMLKQEGKLDIDKPIREYMPEFDLFDPIATLQATPRDLLCHRTGMPRHDLMWANNKDLNRKDLVKRLKYLPNNRPFRSIFQYQNHMFATIGYLIEVLTGSKWEDFISNRIFEPLNIKDFNFNVKSDETGKHAKLYTENEEGINKETPPLVIDGMGPAGSINSTALEMAKWIIFNLNRAKVDGKSLIDENIFPELFNPNIPYMILPFNIEGKVSLGYGLGWFIDMFKGHKVVEHGGNVNGASALISMMPDKNIGCVILTNANSTLLTYAISCEIYDRILGSSDKTDWVELYHTNYKSFFEAMKAQIMAMYNSKVENKNPSHDLSEYTGNFTHPGYGNIVISESLDKSTLHLKLYDLDIDLKHLHYDIFTFEAMGMPFSVSFKTGVMGNIESLSIPFELTIPPIEFLRSN